MKKSGFALLQMTLIAALGLAQMSEQDQAKAVEAYIKAGAVMAGHEALKYFAGRWANPLGSEAPVRMIVKIGSPDECISETCMKLPNGQEFLSMSNRSAPVK